MQSSFSRISKVLFLFTPINAASGTPGNSEISLKHLNPAINFLLGLIGQTSPLKLEFFI